MEHHRARLPLIRNRRMSRAPARPSPDPTLSAKEADKGGAPDTELSGTRSQPCQMGYLSINKWDRLSFSKSEREIAFVFHVEHFLEPES